jgi:hypothetical protein
LTEIVDSISNQVRFSASAKANYVPQDLLEEREITSESQALIAPILRNKMEARTGITVHPRRRRVMASALALRRDELADRLVSVEANPLNPIEAQTPLWDVIEQIDRGVKNLLNEAETSPWLAYVRERREMKAGLAYPRPASDQAIIDIGEGQTTEFKVKWPKNLAKEIAAFGTTNPGRIYLGVDKGGEVVGLKDVDSPEQRDDLSTRIHGVAANSINPGIPIRVRHEVISDLRVAVIEVPNGAEPVCYLQNGAPYIRRGSLSQPAQPWEVSELYRRGWELKTQG